MVTGEQVRLAVFAAGLLGLDPVEIPFGKFLMGSTIRFL